jgi:hypothetical protein
MPWRNAPQTPQRRPGKTRFSPGRWPRAMPFPPCGHAPPGAACPARLKRGTPGASVEAAMASPQRRLRRPPRPLLQQHAEHTRRRPQPRQLRLQPLQQTHRQLRRRHAVPPQRRQRQQQAPYPRHLRPKRRHARTRGRRRSRRRCRWFRPRSKLRQMHQMMRVGGQPELLQPARSRLPRDPRPPLQLRQRLPLMQNTMQKAADHPRGIALVRHRERKAASPPDGRSRDRPDAPPRCRHPSRAPREGRTTPSTTAASTGRTASTRNSGRNAGTPPDAVSKALWPRPAPGTLESRRKKDRITASGAAERCAGVEPDTPKSAPQVLSVTTMADAGTCVSHAAQGAISCQTSTSLQTPPENSTEQRCSTHHEDRPSPGVRKRVGLGVIGGTGGSTTASRNTRPGSSHTEMNRAGNESTGAQAAWIRR